jgi:hypothetical protein
MTAKLLAKKAGAGLTRMAQAVARATKTLKTGADLSEVLRSVYIEGFLAGESKALAETKALIRRGT